MRPTAALLVALLALTASLAGCVAIPEDGFGTRSVPSSTPAVSGARALALDRDGSMSAGEAQDGRLALDWGWFQWYEGVLAPAWYAEPATAPFVVTEATASVLYDAMHPMTSPNQRPEFTVWFGVEDSIVYHGFAEGPDVLLSGGTLATFEVELPRGGLVVREGERLVLRIGSYYSDDARQGGVAVRFGDDRGTRLDLVQEPLGRDPRVASTSTLEGRVPLTGGRCQGFDAVSDADLAWVPFVPDATLGPLLGLDITVDRVMGTGPPDVDFVLLDPDGEVAAHAAGSAGHETVRLGLANLKLAPAAGEWQLGIYACTPQQSEAGYTIAFNHGES